MKEEVFQNIKVRLKKYKYCSLEYTEYEDVSDYEIICNTEEVILIYGYNEESKLNEIHWAANEALVLLNEINKLNKKGLISFIPPQWIDEFKKNNFHMYAVWNDYFNNDISKNYRYEENIEILKENECKEASEVTRSCSGQSRGFSGQTEDWMKKWIKDVDSNNVNGKDNAVLGYREENKICGIVCVSIYGHESEKGAILWIREIAVRPEYQGRGIGKKLLNQAFFYGKNHGAKRAFLHADECNYNAIGLYKDMGFVANKDEAEINMILQ